MQQKTADYQLNLSDFALFLSVMKVKEAYQNVLASAFSTREKIVWKIFCSQPEYNMLIRFMFQFIRKLPKHGSFPVFAP